MAENDLFGTWTQDVARSLYSPGAQAESHVRIYEKVADGFKVTCAEVIDGETITWHYTAPAYDGNIYPVHGRSDYDGIKSFKLSENETLGIFTKNGEEIAAYKRKMPMDGKTLTVIEAGQDNGQGQPYWNVTTFTKE